MSNLDNRAVCIGALLDTIEPPLGAEAARREGLRETPMRAARAWDEWMAGYDVDPSSLLKSFVDGSEGYDEMVIVGQIPIFSFCEHHAIPFFGVAHIAYLPKGRVVGLSKLVRVVDAFARRLQVQERITQQTARCIEEELKPRGVGVVLECRHLCLESRGVQTVGSITTTSALTGSFKTEAHVRAEFMALVRGGAK